MAVTKTYNRPKSTVVNSTGIACTLLAAEKPTTPVAIGGDPGNTGNLDCRIQADADESGGADVQDLFRIETAIAVDATSGLITLTVTVTPAKGGDASGTPTGTARSVAVQHDQTMDAWQTAAGRARQA